MLVIGLTDQSVKLILDPSQEQFPAKKSKVISNFLFALIQIVMIFILQNLAHVTTAMLSWHVSKFVAIECLQIEL